MVYTDKSDAVLIEKIKQVDGEKVHFTDGMSISIPKEKLHLFIKNKEGEKIEYHDIIIVYRNNWIVATIPYSEEEFEKIKKEIPNSPIIDKR